MAWLPPKANYTNLFPIWTNPDKLGAAAEDVREKDSFELILLSYPP